MADKQNDQIIAEWISDLRLTLADVIKFAFSRRKQEKTSLAVRRNLRDTGQQVVGETKVDKTIAE